jgi:Na+-translocating ferredoxin:NAD+ oxidoreductase subunit B
MEILIPIFVVGGIGLIAGIGLAIASYYMEVKSDERVEQINAVLPGANCGGCGYTGCEGYANAIVIDGIAINLCAPGGAKVSKAIADITGGEVSDTQKQTAFVFCNGTNNNTSKKALYKGIQTCAAASMISGGPWDCYYGCLGYGDCVSSCPFDAIILKDDVAVINPAKCTGCKKCVVACPKNIIHMNNCLPLAHVVCSNKDKGVATRKLCSVGCIACTKCVKECPEGAISMDKWLAVIDNKKCTGCGKCVEVCPTKCIEI